MRDERDMDVMIRAYLAILSSRTAAQVATAERYAELACRRLRGAAAASAGLVMSITASNQRLRIGRRMERMELAA